MKKLGAILFVIVLILGLPFVATAAQHVEIVNPNGVYSCCTWSPTPTAGILQYGPDADDSFITTQYEADNLTVDFEDPTGGPYTAIRVKLRMNSGGWGTMMYVGVKDGKGSIGNWTVNTGDGFQEYSREWTGLNIDAADLAGLQIQILFDYHAGDEISISAVQVELVSESAEPLQVDFTSTPTSGEEPLTVLFEADYQGEERATYEWDFGDGNISTDPRSSIVSHTYKAGTYTVSLTVTDGTASGTETKENLITVDPAYSPVLEARTKSFHSHRYGKRVCVRLRVKNVGDEMIRKIKVTMYSANGPDADRATWTLLKERERTFHRRWPLKHNRGKNVWMRYNSGTDESLSGKYLILEVYPVEGDFENAATFEKAATNDKVSVKILVP